MSDQTPEQPFFERTATDYTHFRVYWEEPNRPTCKDNQDHFPDAVTKPSKKQRQGKSRQLPLLVPTTLSNSDSLGKVEKRFRDFEAAKILKGRGILFTVHDDGRHLVIERSGRKIVDLWPMTARWIHRLTGEKGFGLDSLIEYISMP